MKIDDFIQRERGTPGQYEGNLAHCADSRDFTAADDYAINANTGLSAYEASLLESRGVHPKAPFEITLEDFHGDRVQITRIPKTASQTCRG